MFASAQSVMHHFAEPIVAAAGFTGVGYGMRRQRTAGAVLEVYGISIADAKAGVVEADHLQ
jgi:hypothetical protein